MECKKPRRGRKFEADEIKVKAKEQGEKKKENVNQKLRKKRSSLIRHRFQCFQ